MNATEGQERPQPQATGNTPGTAELLGDGRYRLGPILGAGGMGLVRRATDEVLHREVAIKLLADNLAADPDARARFLREARAAARVSDPHVVAVHDVGEQDGRPYLVMELVDGASLADQLARLGPLDPDEVVGVAAQALAGLAAAHAAGLLHRDVKPGNLLRGQDGRVRVADFGVAEAADTPGLTRTGFVLGTRSYLAPERRRGAPASPATDLYALGATLAELLTGTPPDDGAPALPAPTPPALRRLVELLLATDPAARPATAELALDLLAGGSTATANRAAAAVDDDAAAAPAADEATVVPYDAPTEPWTQEPPTRHGTRPMTVEGGATTAPRADAAAPAASGAATAPPGAAARGWRDYGWRVVLGLGLLLLGVGLAARLAGDDSPPPEASEPAEDADDGSPADGARNLARWLREQAGDP